MQLPFTYLQVYKARKHFLRKNDTSSRSWHTALVKSFFHQPKTKVESDSLYATIFLPFIQQFGFSCTSNKHSRTSVASHMHQTSVYLCTLTPHALFMNPDLRAAMTKMHFHALKPRKDALRTAARWWVPGWDMLCRPLILILLPFHTPWTCYVKVKRGDCRLLKWPSRAGFTW